HVSELVEQLLGRLGPLELVELLARGVKHRLDCGKVESARGGAALHLARIQRRREICRHLAEHTGLTAGLALLDRIPIAPYLLRGPRFELAEDVWVAADQLLAAVVGDLRQIAGS